VSAKGRRKGPDVPFEYFPTPAWCVDRLLDACGHDLLRGVETVLEPGVGDGAIVRAVEAWRCEDRPQWCSKDAPLAWTGVELRRGALLDGTPLTEHHEGQDYRSWINMLDEFDLAIGNPAFSLAEVIIRRALAQARVVVMLLRLGFLGSAARLPFWRALGYQPALYILPDRPSFDGVGADSATYAWFVWGHPMLTGIHHLDATPEAVRTAQRPAVTPLPPQLGLGLEAAE
jgi:hypothetical protein